MVVGVEQTTIYIRENRETKSIQRVHKSSYSYYCILVLTDFLDKQEEHTHRRTQDSGGDWGILF